METVLIITSTFAVFYGMKLALSVGILRYKATYFYTKLKNRRHLLTDQAWEEIEKVNNSWKFWD